MITTQDIDHIKILQDFSPEQRAKVLALGSEIDLPQGTALFQVGDAAKQVYILLEGKITIQVGLTSRPERIEVAVLSEPGDLVGWSGLIRPHSYTASAVCQIPARLMAVDGVALMSLLAEEPAAGFRFMLHVAEVISARLRLIEQVTLKTL